MMYQTTGVDVYKNLNKKARIKYNQEVSNGHSGFLPSLDGLLKNVNVASEVSLGQKEIPLRKIIGTNSHSRSMAFAEDFLPLAELNSEFGSKWVTLYNSHIKEGIRDAISVYEYLNWFYVKEGNKRVSVLKGCKAFSIFADVRRIVPRREDAEHDPTIAIYYEFLDFNSKTGLFTLWFSKLGSFARMNEYLDEYEPNSPFETNKYRHFISNLYNNFRNIYHKNKGNKLPITTGDALLEYLDIYGMPEDIFASDESKIQTLIEELKSQIEAKNTIHTEPIKEVKPNVITSIASIFTPQRPLKIGFVYANNAECSGWAFAHSQGEEHLKNTFKERVVTKSISNVPEDDTAYDHIKQLAEEEMDLVITTSPTLLNPTLKTAIEFPKIKFLNCSENISYKNVNTYHARFHEPRYLLGALAGACTTSNDIGYIAHYPICEVISGINAFALGAKFVNPHARIHVKWAYKWDKESYSSKPISELLNIGTDLIYRDNLPVPNKKDPGYGLFTAKYDFDLNKFVTDVHLGIILCHWGIFYEKIVRNILNDTWKILFDSNVSDYKRINFWWGIDSGLVDIFYSTTHVPKSTQMMLEFFRRMIIQNELVPFKGSIYDQSGKIRIKEGSHAKFEEILNMNWFVDNVIGVIPKKRDFNKEIPLIEKLGVE